MKPSTVTLAMHLGLSLGLGLLSSSAFAANHVEARLAGGTYEIDDGVDKIELESGGLDLRGYFDVSPNVFLRGEYLIASADEFRYAGTDVDSDTDTSVLRLGAGYRGSLGKATLYGTLEYGRVELDNQDVGSDSDSGVILTGGLQDNGDGAFLWNVELGIAQFDDLEGGLFEFTLGYRFNPSFAIVGGVQAYAFEDDYDTEYNLPNGSLGIRYTF